MLEGRFSLGVGSGEALNENILGDGWPSANVRLEMLEEAVEIIRGLWQGRRYSHDGLHYVVENARIYTLPDAPPDILDFRLRAQVDRAGRPDRRRLLLGHARQGDGRPVPRGRRRRQARAGRDQGLLGPGRAGVREDRAPAVPERSASGELAQILPTPAHFEQASQLVSEEMVAEAVPCGPDAEKIVAAFQAFADAGFDELYVQQIGERQADFFDLLARAILPRFSG
jgi:alkanesulfonate monooxygenase SsuD/methylene tetrahydromethanopterin reductase-like flavin-dependent oxidoreductase (luciferase family)